MLPKIEKILSIMRQSIEDWHIDQHPVENPYREGSFEYIIYKKNQIDTIQWHVEDEIRRPDLPDSELVLLKRRIDSLNQERTDTVEILDDWFYNYFKSVPKQTDARMNSETPAWLLDRMSILELKIYHMKEQTERRDVSDEHIQMCSKKLDILLEQRDDLSKCFTELIEDLQTGKKFMKVYRQMKMYNDKNLNPALYGNQKPLL
ncbi:MAG: DUF4254 domain-containing protein [Leptospiraceae bacterium]|nr:DUF4254 domain-containing protein [Leptospiraceae bacterium]